MVSIASVRSLRKRQTSAEGILWSKLRAKRFHGLKFRRQVPIDQYVADFCCFEKRLIVELDGAAHALRKRKDVEREVHLYVENFQILRFTNHQVLLAMEFVLNTIAEKLLLNVPSPFTGEGARRAGEGGHST